MKFLRLRRQKRESNIILLLLLLGASSVVSAALLVRPSPAFATSWYSFGTLHSVASSVQITEPDYTTQIANGSRFSIGGVSAHTTLNYSRAPTVDAAYKATGATSGCIGDCFMWSESIACGCGDDWAGSANPHTIHTLFADANFLELQYNNSRSPSGVQPRDNYTWLFFRGSDAFVWKVDEKITSSCTGSPCYTTGWNGYDQALSIFGTSTPALQTACMTSTGSLKTSTSTVTCGLYKTSQSALKEYQFSGITDPNLSNASIYLYPISTSSPYYTCSAGNNGEMKCEGNPNTGGAGSGAPITYAAGWDFSVTFVVYPTYNDAGTANTNAVNMAKSLYFSQYASKIGYSKFETPAYCNPAQPGGNQAQGCYPTNTANGAGMLENAYSFFVGFATGLPGSFSLINQTVGSPSNNSANPLTAMTYGSSAEGMSQNLLVNSTGTTHISSNPAAAGYKLHTSGGSPAMSMTVSQTGITGNVTTIMPSSKNWYIDSFASTVTASTGIRTLSYSVSGAGKTTGGSCDTTGGEASFFIRTINTTTWDFEYKDSNYGNWVGFVVGQYGSITGNGTIALNHYSNACHDHYDVVVDVIANTVGHAYTSGTYSGALYILPHYGNITSVAQIDSYSVASVTMSTESQMYQKPVNLANQTEPLALERQSSGTTLLYANSTGSGYDATVATLSGTQTRYFLWNQTLGGTLTSVIGSTSWSQSALSGGFQNVTVTFTSTGKNLLDFSTAATTTTTSSTTTTTSSSTTTVSTSSTTTSNGGGGGGFFYISNSSTVLHGYSGTNGSDLSTGNLELVGIFAVVVIFLAYAAAERRR